MSKKRTIIVTMALPYANADIHLGTLLEGIQTDIWARFLRLQGHQVYYICGSDAHGTPVMLAAEKKGLSPEQMVSEIRAAHQADFAAFHVKYDNFFTTHSDYGRELAEGFFKQLVANGDIVSRDVSQAFDPIKQMFLPDRYVKGECPKCGAADQYGDNCESCGATYSPTELVNPVSTVSGEAPIQKTSTHVFFKLANYAEFLQQWVNSDDNLQQQVANKLNEWFEAGLQDWDISRDAPYFGFEIPGYPGKYFYVWMDAPIGYIASFRDFCDRHPELDWQSHWAANSETELYHFIGKDIVYFHSLFWPAMLKGAGYKLPNAVYAHGFVTVNGAKMSKSRGTFINAKQYLALLNPEYLRYYYAAKLGNQLDDLDFNPADFKLRINSDLVGKVVNIASRVAGFIQKKFDGTLDATMDNNALFERITQASQHIATAYEQRQYAHAVRDIMALADDVNKYINDEAPWQLLKNDNPDDAVRAHQICTTAINCFKQIMIMLSPVVPALAQQAQDFLRTPLTSWAEIGTPLLSHAIEPFKPMMTRITDEQLEQLMQSHV